METTDKNSLFPDGKIFDFYSVPISTQLCDEVGNVGQLGEVDPLEIIEFVVIVFSLGAAEEQVWVTVLLEGVMV